MLYVLPISKEVVEMSRECGTGVDLAACELTMIRRVQSMVFAVWTPKNTSDVTLSSNLRQ